MKTALVTPSPHELTVVRVQAPYEPAFVEAMKTIGAQWDAADKVWEFPLFLTETVVAICVDYFEEVRLELPS